jgi:prephenate dehydrogenase
VRIAVLGVGLIGGSIGLAAKEWFDDADVVGFGRSPERLDRARDLGAIERSSMDIAEALAEAEVCFACGPVGALPDLVERALAAAPEDCVVTDVGSTKRRIVEAITDQRFVGGHPIAGAETAGVENARADLFKGATWYLTPGGRSSGVLYERLHRFVVGVGARPLAIDAETHDRLLATVSHLPHVIANVLVSQAARALDEQGEALPRVGPSFRDATRVAGANTDIWTDIYLSNAASIADEVDETARRLEAVAAALRAGEPPALAEWNEEARIARQRLLEADLAGGPVHELRVPVPNRPGIVAELAVALGRAGVNIVDMALAPAPDMRSGAITFWIAGEEAAARAKAVVDDLDFGDVIEQ